MGKVKEVILDQEQMEERVRYWQDKLSLRDWVVDIVFERGFNMGVNTAFITIVEDHRRARIKMTVPGDYNPASLLPYDMEQVIVHELLHIHFWPLTKTLGDNMAEEQAIQAISCAMVNLDRKAEEIEDYYIQRVTHKVPPMLLLRMNSDPAGGYE